MQDDKQEAKSPRGVGHCVIAQGKVHVLFRGDMRSLKLGCFNYGLMYIYIYTSDFLNDREQN